MILNSLNPLLPAISKPDVWLVLESAAVLIIALVLAFIAITLKNEKQQRARIEVALKQVKISEENYRQIFDNAHDGILIHNSDYDILSANPACVILTGYPLEELKKLKILKLLPNGSQLDLKSVEQNLFSQEKTGCTIDAKFIKKDKSEVFVQLSINPVQNNGKSLSFQCTVRDVSEQKRMEENLHYYLKQVTRAQEEERKRIALELHDETVQYLIVFWRQLETLSLKSKELTPESIILIQELREQTKNVIQSVRRLSQDLRPATLDRLGLLPALEHLADETAGYSGIATKISVLGTERRLPEEVGLMLFRITQEAIRNALRHSGATQAEIIVEFSQGKVKVSIKDNGKGFYLPSNIGDLSQKGKLGLVGMQERARLINGQFSITSEPEKGTNISVEVPG